MKIIKSILLSLLLLSFLFSLTGCKPDGMLKDTYDLAKQAISVMEDYHDFKITSQQADERLELIQNQLKLISERDNGKQTGRSKYSLTNGQHALNIRIKISSFITNKNFGYNNSDTITPLKELKNYIN